MPAMPNDKKRPVFFDLLRIRQPVTAVLSVGHRLSGVALLLSIPLLVYLFDRSLDSEQGYRQVAELLQGAPARLVLLLLLWVFLHHFFSGIRYLLIDVDVGVDIRRARTSAWLVFALEAVAVIVAAVALW
jgi:succinate dehydrogenase / fumarate reductase cytochrome b subunit